MATSDIIALIAGALSGGGEAWQVKQQQDRQKKLDDARLQQERDQAEHQRQELARQQEADRAHALDREQGDVTTMLGAKGPWSPVTSQEATRTRGANLGYRLQETPDLTHSMFEGMPTAGIPNVMSQTLGIPNEAPTHTTVRPTAPQMEARDTADAAAEAARQKKINLTEWLKTQRPEVQSAVQLGQLTGKEPTLQPDALVDPAVQAQRALDAKVNEQNTLGPLRTNEAVNAEKLKLPIALKRHAGEKAIDQQYAQTADVDSIAQAIVRGDQPPDLKGLYRNTAGVRASLAKSGYNLTQATEDWNATSKYINSGNSPGAVRLRQAVDFTDESLGKVEQLASQWKSGGYGPLSRAALTLAMQGANGPEAQSLATRFQAQIADVTSELGTVYKGGNGSTDESLKLAAKNLQADWSEKALLDNVAQIHANLGYRRNSLKTAGVFGASANNPYTPGAAGRTPAGAAAPPPAGAPKVMRFDAQGNLIP